MLAASRSTAALPISEAPRGANPAGGRGSPHRAPDKAGGQRERNGTEPWAELSVKRGERRERGKGLNHFEIPNITLEGM